MKKLKTAIAGYGKGGRVYNSPIISDVDGFVINTILTSNEENIKAAIKDHPTAKIVSDFKKILMDPEIDLVIITAPNHFHSSLAKQALNAGKHVVVEKPFTPTVEQADELIELAQKNSLILTVNHNRRWDNDILTIKKLLKEERLGKVVEYEAHFDRFRTEIKDNWKEEKDVPGSGILYDLGSHLIDQALLLFGKPSEIFAVLRNQRENSEVTDNFEVLLFYPDLKVTLKAGMLVKEPGPSFSIFGRKGSYIKFGRDPQEGLMKAGARLQDHPRWGEEPKDNWGFLNTVEEKIRVPSEKGDYRSFYRNVYNAIINQQELLVKPEEARDVIKVIELAIKSNSEKRVVTFE